MGRLKLNWLGGEAIATYTMDQFPGARQEWLDGKHMLYVLTL